MGKPHSARPTFLPCCGICAQYYSVGRCWSHLTCQSNTEHPLVAGSGIWQAAARESSACTCSISTAACSSSALHTYSQAFTLRPSPERRVAGIAHQGTWVSPWLLTAVESRWRASGPLPQELQSTAPPMPEKKGKTHPLPQELILSTVAYRICRVAPLLPQEGSHLCCMLPACSSDEG